MTKRFVAGVTTVLFALGLAGMAIAAPAPQPTPVPTAAPSPIPTVPPAGGLINAAINALGNAVKSGFGWQDNEAYGTVTYFKRYDMQVRMALNRYRTIRLHPGTVINPRGTSLKVGDIVDVRGRAQSDGSLLADNIVLNGTP